jgi:hypothetical protein
MNFRATERLPQQTPACQNAFHISLASGQAGLCQQGINTHLFFNASHIKLSGTFLKTVSQIAKLLFERKLQKT